MCRRRCGFAIGLLLSTPTSYPRFSSLKRMHRPATYQPDFEELFQLLESNGVEALVSHADGPLAFTRLEITTALLHDLHGLGGGVEPVVFTEHVDEPGSAHLL